MPSPFDAIWTSVTSPTFDAAFAEPVTVEPEALTKRARVKADLPDPNVEPFDVIGIFRGNTVVNSPKTRPSTTDTVDVVVQETTVDFALSQFTAVTMPREGWNVTLSSRTPVPRYRIVAARDDKVARLVCTLDYVEDVA